MLLGGAEEGLEPSPGLFGDPGIRHDPALLVQTEVRVRPQITLSLEYGDEAEPDRFRILLRGGRAALLRVVADNLLKALVRELRGSRRNSESQARDFLRHVGRKTWSRDLSMSID